MFQGFTGSGPTSIGYGQFPMAAASPVLTMGMRCHRVTSIDSSAVTHDRDLRRSQWAALRWLREVNIMKLRDGNRVRLSGKCGLGGKRRYRDHSEAIAALHGVANARYRAELDGVETRRREVRAYECDFCHGWHLTSKQVWTSGGGPVRGKTKDVS